MMVSDDSFNSLPGPQDSGSDHRVDGSAAAFEFSFLTDEPASASTTDTDQSAASNQPVTRRRRRMSPQHIRRIKRVPLALALKVQE